MAVRKEVACIWSVQGLRVCGSTEGREHALSSVKMSDSQGQVRSDCHGGDRSGEEARGGKRRQEGCVVRKGKRGNGRMRPENEDGGKENVLAMCCRVHMYELQIGNV